jgi:glycosyltransferase involved in cell wall biosynthesis
MIVKNEAGNLERCLDSVRGLVAEIVAVDTGSTDATPEIARRHGAKVFSFDFTKVDFAAARNYGLGKATGKWILVLDADEVLDGAGWEAMRPLIERDSHAGYFLERHNFSAGSAAAKRDFCVRLFPNRPDYRFRGRVHETVDSSILESGGRLVRTGIRIAHHFAMDKEARRRKNLQYIEILKEELAADPADTTRLDFLAAEYHQLEMFDEATAVAGQIVKMRPFDARAHFFLGVYHLLYQADSVSARADFERALELRPGYAEAASYLQAIG